MVWNQKIAFRIFLAFLIVIFCLMSYFIFVSDDDASAERFFGSIGFESAENADDSSAVPLPSTTGVGGSSGASGGSSGGSSGGTGNSETEILSFCTFDAFHTITSDVPCRCGFTGVCYEDESVCDASFNNGEGYCS